MNYAALEILDFSLQARLRLDPGAATRPVVLCAGSGRRAEVVALNAVATARGLCAGLSPGQAVGLCPELRVWSADEGAEREATALLLSWAWRISPRVEDTAPGLAIADLAGRERGALARDLAEICAGLTAQGLPVRAGVASTPEVARFAARHADEGAVFWVREALDFLQPLPVGLLGLTEGEATLFDSLGLRTLGDVARLPQEAFAQRLGERGATLWARATGIEARPLNTATPPTRHVARHDLEEPVETLEPLLFLLRRFVDRLAGEVAAAGRVAETLRLTLQLEDETTHERNFRLPQATAQAESLFRVLEQHLGTVRTQSSVTGLELELRPVAATARQEGLFEESLRDPHGFYETVARVAAVLGAERVGTPVPGETHRPDAVSLRAPPAVIRERATTARAEVFGPVLRRRRPALSATVELGPDDPAPRYVWCAPARVEGAVRCARGPWRRSGEWWEIAKAWSREEWDVELDRGGLHRLAHTAEGWWLEGSYE